MTDLRCVCGVMGDGCSELGCASHRYGGRETGFYTMFCAACSRCLCPGCGRCLAHASERCPCSSRPGRYREDRQPLAVHTGSET